jgi:glycosyltransferase involved in cell wall biosynthesis
MLLIDALYINNSGGKVLLDYLISELSKREEDIFYLLDKRCEESYIGLKLKNAIFVEASLKNRKSFYQNDQKKFTHIFCFANLAPPIKCSGKVFTYFHNLLLSEVPSGTPLKKKVILLLKRFLAKRIAKNSDEFIVQTNYAKKSFLKAFGNHKVSVIPFFNDFGIKPGIKQKNTFLYVSDGNPHKNHKTLLDAWTNVNIPNCELWLTISSNYPNVQQQIKHLSDQGYQIKNFTGLKREELNALYGKAEYLIYPSLLESFGLGLIEGALANCKVLAADLPYSNQVVIPTEIFNPNSVTEIAEIIKSASEGKKNNNSQLIVNNEITNLMNKILINN